MATATDRLTLVQWLSPSFPVGAYSYSHGLEAAAETGLVRGAAGLRDWTETILRHGAGRSDALFLAAAWRAGDPARLAEIHDTARAFAPSRERLLETDAQGAAFRAAVNAVWRLGLPDLAYPVAVGRAARLRSLPLAETAELYLHAFLSNLVAAGLRLSLTGQTAGQKIIADLAPLCPEIAAETADGDLDDLAGTAFLSDIASMHHETQYSRMFRT